MTTSDSKAAFRVAGWLSLVLSASTIALLLLSWGALLWFIALETDLLLPYHTSWYDHWGWPQDTPPAGSWQRNLNYFFESPVGAALPAILTVGASAYLLGVILFREPQLREKRIPLLLSFAVSNLVSVPVMFLASYAVVALFAGRLTGWSSTAILWLPTCLLLAVLFALQIQMLPKRFLPRWCS